MASLYLHFNKNSILFNLFSAGFEFRPM